VFNFEIPFNRKWFFINPTSSISTTAGSVNQSENPHSWESCRMDRGCPMPARNVFPAHEQCPSNPPAEAGYPPPTQGPCHRIELRLWLRRYMAAIDQMPGTLASNEKLEQFLTDLACRHHVSASTQNQALNAILFFYQQSSSDRSRTWMLCEPSDSPHASSPQRGGNVGSVARVPVVALRELWNGWQVNRLLLQLHYFI